MSPQKIITLQFGNYTNYVGAHFWNIQELSLDTTECDRDILYREGQTMGEVTYTPRLLLCDLKGSLNTFPCGSGLPDDHEQDQKIRCENFDKSQAAPAPKDKKNYVDPLDKGGTSGTANATATKQYKWCIKSWTDYLAPKLHPRTINILNEYSHSSDDDDGTSFEIFHIGKSIWNSYFGEEFSENIRKYFEECDSIQGFHVNFDCTDGFSGLAVGCMEHLVDEYTINPILAHPLIASHYPDNSPVTQRESDSSCLKDTTRLANIVLSFQALSEYSDLFVPLCTGENGWRKPGKPRYYEYVHYDHKNYYHTSSILASALDTLSMSYRLKNTEYTMSDICAFMTGDGRKMAAATLGLPFPIEESQNLIDVLSNHEDPLYMPITPSCDINTEGKLVQFITVRGIPEDRVKKPAKNAVGFASCKNVTEMFIMYLLANNYYAETKVTVCGNQPLETKNPFPQYFARGINKYGFINGNKKEIVESCPAMAGYHNGDFVMETIGMLHKDASNLKFCQLHKFAEEGLEASEYREILNKLADFKDSYESEYDDDDDDDDCD